MQDRNCRDPETSTPDDEVDDEDGDDDAEERWQRKGINSDRGEAIKMTETRSRRSSRRIAMGKSKGLKSN